MILKVKKTKLKQLIVEGPWFQSNVEGRNWNVINIQGPNPKMLFGAFFFFLFNWKVRGF